MSTELPPAHRLVRESGAPVSAQGVDRQWVEPTALQREVIDLFVRGVRVLGLPKSIGEIYGLLYASPEPLPLDAIVAKLGISKGSASQGLRFLRNLGAVRPVEVDGERREHFLAVAELKKLATGFIRGELLPHMESGSAALGRLAAMADDEGGEHAEFYVRRVAKLQTWSNKAGGLLKLAGKFLR